MVQARRPSRNRRAHRVVVCGGFKAGKSTLVNALLGARVSPTDAVASTQLPLTVFGGEEAAGIYIERDAGPAFETIATNEVHDTLLGHDHHAVDEGGESRAASASRPAEILSVVVRLDHPLLAAGLILVDTPPISGGLRNAATLTVLAELQRASGFLYLLDASEELSRPELDLIEAALDICPTMLCCLTKIDLHGSWREVAARNQGLLERVGVSSPVLPVSSRLFLESGRYRDTALRRRSGLPLLRRFLTDAVVGRGARNEQALLARTIGLTASELAASIRAEATAASDRSGLDQLRAEVAHTEARAARVDDPSSPWQTVLRRALRQFDDTRRGHLRAALADTRRTALAWIADDDPVDVWETLEGDLQAEVNRLVSTHLGFIRQQARRVVVDVTQALEQDAADLGISLDDYRAPAGPIATELEERGFEGRIQMAQSGILASRVAGPVGIMLFGLLTGPLGPPLAAVAGASAAMASGAVFLVGGRRSNRQLRQRQAEQAVRTYLEDAAIVVERISNDAANWVTDQLSDGFNALTAQVRQAAQERRQAYEAATRRQRPDPERLQVLQREAQEIDVIRVLSDQVMAGRA